MNPHEQAQAEKQIEISIQEAELSVQDAKDLKELIVNPLFDKIITVGYFQNNAIRTVALLADPSMEAKEDQEGLTKDLHAISALQRYLRNIITRGAQMESKIAASEATLEEVREDEAGE